MIKKEYLKKKGVITEISELVHIQREGIPDLYKRVLTIETIDKQILYPELRNGKLKMLEDLYENSVVEIEFSFEGSEKNNKKYNNIYINNITRL
jgi:hypothetical protein